MKTKIIFFLSIFFYQISPCAAAVIRCTHPSIGFFNGMLNSIKAANDNFAVIKNNLYTYDNVFTKAHMPFNYVLFYNNTEGITKDLSEIFQQLKYEEEGEIPSSERTKLDQAEHERLANDIFKKNMGMLLIGHSQGNFFLNHMFEYCENNAPQLERTRCSAVQIGSPTSQAGGFPPSRE